MLHLFLAVDATGINMPAIDFACYLAKLHHSTLTVLALENMVADEKPVMRKLHGARVLDWAIDEASPAVREKRALMEDNMKSLQAACANRGVRVSVRFTEGPPSKDVVAMTRFCDLLVLDPATSFRRKFEGTPSDFAKNVLASSECPVIIAPEQFDAFDEIVFTYDGSASSVFAMKQFAYLFPQLDDKKVTVLHINDEQQWTEEEKKELGGWLQNHYSSIGFDSRPGDASYELLGYLLLRRHIFIVMGAYGRNALSRYFRHSHADLVIRTTTQPIFIAHH